MKRLILILDYSESICVNLHVKILVYVLTYPTYISLRITFTNAN